MEQFSGRDYFKGHQTIGNLIFISVFTASGCGKRCIFCNFLKKTCFSIPPMGFGIQRVNTSCRALRRGQFCVKHNGMGVGAMKQEKRSFACVCMCVCVLGLLHNKLYRTGSGFQREEGLSGAGICPHVLSSSNFTTCNLTPPSLS